MRWIALLAAAPLFGESVVLAYHRFGQFPGSTTTRPEVFEAQVRAIQERNIPIVPLVELAATPGMRAVAITIDDGHASVYSVLFPIVQRLRVPVTLFVYPSAVSRALYALSWKQLRAMRQSGLVDVQSHTLWHPDFPRERRRRAPRDYQRFVEKQLVSSKAVLEQRLAKSVTILAWPYGNHDPLLEQEAQRAGYVAAFTVEPRPAAAGDPAFRLPRYSAPNSAGPAFQRILDAAGQRPRVIDRETGQPVSGAIVTVSGETAETDAHGFFDLPLGTRTLSIRAPGYRRLQAGSGPATFELTPFLPKALYLSTFGVGDPRLRAQALDRLGKNGLNALVIDVKGDRGLAGYPSKVPMAASIGAQKRIAMPDLATLIAARKSKGDYLIARIVVFKDTLLAHAEPRLALKTKTGEIWRDHEDLAWTDPFLPEVRQYNLDLAVEAAGLGFDEIQFDYVRFPDHRDLVFSRADTEENRVKAIEEFLIGARQRLKAYNVFIAADVFGYVCWNTNDTGIGQTLERIMPLVDYLSPMLYPSAFHAGIPGTREPTAYPYEIVRGSLEKARERTGANPLRFRPWLQAFRDYAFDRREFGAKEIHEQIRAAEESGTAGWMLWNPHNIYPEF